MHIYGIMGAHTGSSPKTCSRASSAGCWSQAARIWSRCEGRVCYNSWFIPFPPSGVKNALGWINALNTQQQMPTSEHLPACVHPSGPRSKLSRMSWQPRY